MRLIWKIERKRKGGKFARLAMGCSSGQMLFARRLLLLYSSGDNLIHHSRSLAAYPANAFAYVHFRLRCSPCLPRVGTGQSSSGTGQSVLLLSRDKVQ